MHDDTDTQSFLDNTTFVTCFLVGAAVAIVTNGAWFAVFAAGILTIVIRKGFAVSAVSHLLSATKSTRAYLADNSVKNNNIVVLDGKKMKIVGTVVQPSLSSSHMIETNSFSLENQPDSTTSVRLGTNMADHDDVVIDFMTTFHVGLFGMSGCGKDNLLRCIFLSLALRNSPRDVQFAFIDGKGEWLIAPLPSLAHMFIPPAGGYGDEGDKRMMQAIQLIDNEAKRRSTLFCSEGCVSREEYIAKTGINVPLIFVVMSDVMGTVDGDLEKLLANLVSKARSIGMRVIVSMQTPTGKSTRWRTNLGANISGYQSLSSQDAPSLGCDPSEMKVRPSELSASDKGIFVYRNGQSQCVFKAPFLADSDRDVYFTQLKSVKSNATQRQHNSNTTPLQLPHNAPQRCNDVVLELSASESEVVELYGNRCTTPVQKRCGVVTPQKKEEGHNDTTLYNEYNSCNDDEIVLTLEQAKYIVACLKDSMSISAIVKKLPNSDTRKYMQNKRAVELFIVQLQKKARVS